MVTEGKEWLYFFVEAATGKTWAFDVENAFRADQPGNRIVHFAFQLIIRNARRHIAILFIQHLRHRVHINDECIVVGTTIGRCFAIQVNSCEFNIYWAGAIWADLFVSLR